MSTGDAPERIHIDLPPNEVHLSFDDIFGPTLQKAAAVTQAGPGAATDPELAQHAQTLAGLLAQLKDVVDKINAIDPNFLRSNPL